MKNFNKFNQLKDEDLSLLNSPKFAYFMGLFCADGCFYFDTRSYRFEFSDGSSVRDELKYSYEFLTIVKKIIEDLLDIKLSPLRKRGNRYVLSFRCLKLAKIFKNHFNFKPGLKSGSIIIPAFYRNNQLEKFFWLGVIDGDGMVARDSKKIALCSISERLINDFIDFLKKNKIKVVYTKRKLDTSPFSSVNVSHTATVGSAFFNNYIEVLGFYHPRKKLWVKNLLEKKKGYITNKFLPSESFILKNSDMFDLSKIFNSSRIFVVNGKKLLGEFGIKYQGRNNVRFVDVFGFLKGELSKGDFYKKLNDYWWKMSKGSTVSVKLPLYFDESIKSVARFVRIRDGGIILSRNYLKAYKMDVADMIKEIELAFNIKVKYTSKKEPFFSSGVLHHFFSKIIKREEKVYSLPQWHKKLS